MTFVNGDVPPTTFWKAIVPPVPARTVNAWAPFRVLENVMLAPAAVPPAFVVSMETSAPRVVGPPKVTTPPLVVILLFTLTAVVPVYVMAPVVFAVLDCVIVSAVMAILVKAVVPPMAPENVVVPVPPARVNARAPFNVLLKVTFALFEVIVLAPANVTGAEKIKGFAPLTAILLAIDVNPALVCVMFVKGMEPPTAPVNVVVAVPAASVKACAPFNVLLNVIPAFGLVIVVAAFSNTGLGNVKAFAPVKVTLPPN